ncbi:MAG TPA: GNAT family N-acetyltransferase [Nocardioidaceae bacterium]|nr:GNAT family N-acetyltransferase [Nocardioidaceae bacterium]
MFTPILRPGSGLPSDAGFTLRPLGLDDAPRFAEALNDPEIRYWMHGVPESYSEADARRDLGGAEEATPAEAEASDDPYWAWAVVDADDRLVGKIALSDLTESGITLSYWLHPAGRRKGWMTVAVRAIARWTASPSGPGVACLRANVAAANHSSRSVLERVGFVPEEAHGDYKMGDGSYAEGMRYVLDLVGDAR